jgi:sec-independent protein translocase protein TatA
MGLSVWHLLIITVIVLLLFGPNRLPQLGKSIGEAIKGFKKGLGDEEIDVTERSRREQINQSQQTGTTDQTTVNNPEQKKDKV